MTTVPATLPKTLPALLPLQKTAGPSRSTSAQTLIQATAGRSTSAQAAITATAARSTTASVLIFSNVSTYPFIVNPHGYSDAQISAMLVTPGYTITGRFRLLDGNLNPVSVPGSLNLSDPSDISQWVDAPSISNDTTQAVHRQLTATLHEIPGLSINVMQHLIEARVRYEDSSGNLLFEVQKGIFCFTEAHRTLLDSGNVWQLTMLDQTVRLQIKLWNTYTVEQGTNVVGAITTLLTMGAVRLSQGGTGQTPAGLDCIGPGLPSSRVQIAASTLTTPMPVTFTTDQTISDAVNMLAASINYWPVTFDEAGNAISWQKPYFSASIPQTRWSYKTDDSHVIRPGVDHQLANLNQLGNCARVIVEGTAAAPFSATATNNDTTSPLYRGNIGGRELPIVIKDSTIPDQATAQLRANLACQEAAMVMEKVVFDSFNPFHGSHELIALVITDANGNAEVGSDGSRLPWLEESWSLDIAARTMSHTVARAITIAGS